METTAQRSARIATEEARHEYREFCGVPERPLTDWEKLDLSAWRAEMAERSPHKNVTWTGD